MRNYFVVSALAVLALTVLRSPLSAQTPSSKVADLSGDWAPDPTRGGIGQSLSLSDIAGRKRGKEDDIPYQPWALEKTISEKPSTGPEPQFGATTDPQVPQQSGLAEDGDDKVVPEEDGMTVSEEDRDV